LKIALIDAKIKAQKERVTTKTKQEIGGLNMKIEEIYRILDKYAGTLKESEKIRDIVTSHNRVNDTTVPAFMLANLLMDIQEDIITKAVKSCKNCSIPAACERILKGSDFPLPWTGKDGHQYFFTNYYGVALSSPLNFCQTEFKENKMEYIEETMTETPAKCVRLKIPNLPLVKAHININKEGRNPVFWDFGPGYGLVNAQYLANILEALPKCTAKTLENDLKPIYFETPDKSKGILMPAKPSKKIIRENTFERYYKRLA
jgi:hypothetical protein